MRPFFGFMLCVLLAGCAANRAAPEMNALRFSTRENPVQFYSEPDLRFPAGTTVYRLEETGARSDADIETGITLVSFYDHIHHQLLAQGFRRARFDQRGLERVNARYERGRERLELRIEGNAQSGRYRLRMQKR